MASEMVSVLVPVHNTAPYLRECLDSIVGLSYSNWHAVLIDDGSTDESLAICHEYARLHDNIEVFSQENKGIAATRNVLMRHIRGERFLFVDSDDWIEPEMVEEMMRYPDDIVMCGVYGFDGGKAEKLNRRGAVERFLRHEHFEGKITNKLIRSNLVEGLRLPEPFEYGEDAWLVWKFLQRMGSMTITDRQLYHYRLREDSISTAAFDEKKMSAYDLWEGICGDVERAWPEFSDLAMARRTLECVSLLRLAAMADWPHDGNITKLQRRIRSGTGGMWSSKLASWKELVYSWIVARWYWVGKAYIKMRRML